MIKRFLNVIQRDSEGGSNAIQTGFKRDLIVIEKRYYSTYLAVSAWNAVYGLFWVISLFWMH